MATTIALADVSGVVTGGAGRKVTGLVAENDSAGVLWIQLHNLAADPVNEAPLVAIRVPAGAQVAESFRDHGPEELGGLDAAFALGIAWGWSSTRDTYTAHGTAADVALTLFHEEP